MDLGNVIAQVVDLDPAPLSCGVVIQLIAKCTCDFRNLLLCFLKIEKDSESQLITAC